MKPQFIKSILLKTICTLVQVDCQNYIWIYSREYQVKIKNSQKESLA